ncbi:hypothetical protein KQI22_03490 [Kineothrix sp. MSJ-39]|uniref:hypothetical protein n=1 Tax=Kineothrix sp. MSJ-39 TaxID=2841533 RepID=UPI001C0FC95B|nr:hypothetical protein [Kineothrix sp. MSJ-39]MBU5429131.1 hypothetical protein [Kineothrix sp. MSJ-39]
MQKTEYGYRRVVWLGIICLVFALCMGKYTYGSVVVDEVLIGGQEEDEPVDAVPAAQVPAESGISQPVSERQEEPATSQSASEPQEGPATSQPTSERKAKTAASGPKVTGTPRPDTETSKSEKFPTPVSQADGMETDAEQLQVPAEPTASVSANDRQQFHVPQQETQADGDKTAKSENSSGKNSSEETTKQEMKAQKQPSIWQDSAETAGKEKSEGKAESEEKSGNLLLPVFIILCSLLLLSGSICLIRDNNIDLKK